MYTGVRHGELVSLAREDIDLKAGTMMTRRNHTLTKEFTLPKTDAGTDRVINLIQPTIDVLKSQSELTRLGKQYQNEVKLRGYGRAGHHYAVGSINKSWEAAMRRAGISYRRAYQSRHTYACWSLAAGANPNFIAKQMGHTDAQMVYRVYGSWMAENNQDQVLILNQKLSEFAPSMPHAVGSDGY